MTRSRVEPNPHHTLAAAKRDQHRPVYTEVPPLLGKLREEAALWLRPDASVTATTATTAAARDIEAHLRGLGRVEHVSGWEAAATRPPGKFCR